MLSTRLAIANDTLPDDIDIVEQRNLHSQFHGKPSIGKEKVESLKQSMLFSFGQRVQTIPHKL